MGLYQNTAFEPNQNNIVCVKRKAIGGLKHAWRLLAYVDACLWNIKILNFMGGKFFFKSY